MAGIRVELTKETGDALAKVGASKVSAVAVGTGPYTAWVDNRSWADLDIRVFWVESDSPSVATQTGGKVFSGQVAPYILGGANGCARLAACRLYVFYNNQPQPVGDTGIVRPDASDGNRLFTI